jgi:hypothetical protein
MISGNCYGRVAENRYHTPRAGGRNVMDINESNEIYGRIARVINELKMDRKSVTVYKVAELTGLDPLVVFNYFYEKGLLKGK